MRSFSYAAPKSLGEARTLLGRDVRPLAGGTDLLTLMKGEIVAPETLVSVRALLPRGIERRDGRVTIGAGATLADVARDEHIRSRYAALAQAAQVAASPQLRNMATIGGNLLQRPRCWYFRHPLVPCWLKGGDECPARAGESQRHAVFDASPCVAVHPSDLATALLAFDAHVRVLGAAGERDVALAAFFTLPRDEHRCETSLDHDELVLSLALPAPPAQTRSVYLKAMDRAAFSFALVGTAVVLRLSAEGEVDHARIVLGGVAPVPWRAPAAERVLLGAKVDRALLERAADAALADARPLPKNAWKLPLARALLLRALALGSEDGAATRPAVA